MATRKAKPEKPRSGFPRSPHQSSQRARKIRGRFHDLSRRAEPDNALRQSLRLRDYLLLGRTPPPKRQIRAVGVERLLSLSDEQEGEMRRQPLRPVHSGQLSAVSGAPRALPRVNRNRPRRSGASPARRAGCVPVCSGGVRSLPDGRTDVPRPERARWRVHVNMRRRAEPVESHATNERLERHLNDLLTAIGDPTVDTAKQLRCLSEMGSLGFVVRPSPDH